MSDFNLSTKGLDSILKMLKSKSYVKVGVLGDSGTRGSGTSSKSPTNAQILAFHEFGTHNMPKRSVLKEPIADKLDERLQEVNLLDKKMLTQIIKTASPYAILSTIAILAEDVVSDAFATEWLWKMGAVEKS